MGVAALGFLWEEVAIARSLPHGGDGVHFRGLLALTVFMALLLGPSAAVSADPLFESDEVLAIRLEGPLKAMARDRSSEPEERPGVLTYTEADGTSQRFEIQLRPRGRSRRDREVCTFPPLRVNVRKGDVENTLFAGQDKLKVVTHCRRSSRHDRYVYKEYLAYRLLNRLTDVSFKVRPLDIEWVEQGGGVVERRFGFFIEHEDRLARRLGMKVAEPDAIDRGRFEPEHSSLMALFQFMIGNTDFSFIASSEEDDCCHNSAVLTDAQGRQFPIPYDFDITGFVDPPYAVVDQQLSIRNVRQRLYRGSCYDEATFARTVAHFRQARAGIDEVLGTETALDDKSRDNARRFVDGFFEIIEDPRAFERRVVGDCRGTV